MNSFPLMQLQPSLLLFAILFTVLTVLSLLYGISAIVTKRMPMTVRQQVSSMLLNGERKTEMRGKQVVIAGWCFVGLSIFAALVSTSVWYKIATHDPSTETRSDQFKYLEQSRSESRSMERLRQERHATQNKRKPGGLRFP